MTFPLVRLDECSRIVSGATPSTNMPEFWGGDIFWVTPADLSKLDGPIITHTPRMITAVGLASCAAEVLPPNSVLFSSRAPIGHVAINTVPMATNQGFKSFIPAPDKLDHRYLYYWLRTNRTYLEALGNGATFKEVSKAVVSRIKLPLPPLDKQRRIAAILNQADDLRRKRRQALSKLSELATNLLVYLFGDPARNPKGWPVCRLGDLCNSVSDGPHVSPEYVASGVPFLSTRNIRRDGIVWDDLKFISEADAKLQWKKVKPARGDILYTKGGTTGIARAVDFDLDFAVWVHVAVLKLSKNKVEPVWLQEMLNSAYCYHQSQRLTKGIVNRDLGLRRMVDIIFPLPPLDLQRAFTTRVAEIEKLKAHYRGHLARLDALFASLQHRAFRGEL